MPPAASTSDAPARKRRRLAALLVLSLAVGCSRGPESRVETLHVFGGVTEIELRGAEPASAQAAIAGGNDQEMGLVRAGAGQQARPEAAFEACPQ